MSTNTLAWTTFAIALIGAGAWIPIVVTWFRKPKVYLVLADNAEISYMEFGSIINFGCAFATFDKAALIQSIKLTVEHESGRRSEFRCVGLSEGTTAHSSTGERVAWDKYSRTHTITLSQDSSADRQLMFRHSDMMDSLRDRFNAIMPAISRLQEANPDTWRDALRQTPELDEYMQTVRNGQLWQQGSYQATLIASIKQLAKPVLQTFTFEVSDADLRAINSNLTPIETYSLATILQVDQAPIRPAYAFVYPTIRA